MLSTVSPSTQQLTHGLDDLAFFGVLINAEAVDQALQVCSFFLHREYPYRKTASSLRKTANGRPLPGLIVVRKSDALHILAGAGIDAGCGRLLMNRGTDLSTGLTVEAGFRVLWRCCPDTRLGLGDFQLGMKLGIPTLKTLPCSSAACTARSFFAELGSRGRRLR